MAVKKFNGLEAPKLPFLGFLRIHQGCEVEIRRVDLDHDNTVLSHRRADFGSLAGQIDGTRCEINPKGDHTGNDEKQQAGGIQNRYARVNSTASLSSTLRVYQGSAANHLKQDNGHQEGR